MKFQINTEIAERLPYLKGKSKYDPKMCSVIISTAQTGGQKAQMCINCGITEQTFDKYMSEYQEFKEAYEYAMLHIIADHEALMDAGAKGQIENYNFKANERILSANHKKYQQITDKGVNTTININTINLTHEQRVEKIKQLTEKLAEKGISHPLPSIIEGEKVGN